jgi:hypothetical protein
MSLKSLRGSIRWAIRNTQRAHRLHTDAVVAYVNATTAKRAAVLLPRVTAAEVAHKVALAQLQRLQDARRATYAF